ncbi:hypothetical protein DRO97_08140 [Archaeoglobales archaeon]|nr:MAG: hypothetical protein DRO97_08140 [Archaeoglobales archaeon]
MREIICKNCKAKITPDEYDIQFCGCGVYYRRKRGFHNGWTLTGWWKGSVSEIERTRQATRPRKPRVRSKRL